MTPNEMLDSLCKFQVGQVVVMKVHAVWHEKDKGKPKTYTPAIQPMHVVERTVVQCYGGIQVYYLVRPHMTSRFEGMAYASEFSKVVEIELAELPDDISATETL